LERKFMIGTAARIFGFIYLVVGILGFVPGLSNEAGGTPLLLGLFTAVAAAYFGWAPQMEPVRER
jgi:hypothetical protein